MMLSGGANWLALGNISPAELPDESIEHYGGYSAAIDYRAGNLFLKDSEWHHYMVVIDGSTIGL